MTAAKPHKPDKTFLLISTALFVSGLLILASASLPLAHRDFNNPWYYLIRQLTLGGAVGFTAALLVQWVPVSLLRRFAVPFFVGTILLLFAVLVPAVSVGSGGATRWLQAGPITLQPGEIAKVTLPLYLAAWLASRPFPRNRTRPDKKKVREDERGMLAPFFLLMTAVGAPLLLQPDLSTFGVLAITALFLLFLAGISWRTIAVLLGTGVGAFIVLVRLAPYRMNRILAFTDPQSDPLGIGYQVNQALLAVGSGGLLGRGFGFSREKLFYLPEPMGDSIFAVFAEETGFVGATLLVAAFVLFLWRGMYIVRRLPDPFMQLLVAGLVGWIAIQAFLNIGGNIALLPIVGITLPFISYGSASLAVTLLSVGFVYKMSRYTHSV